MNAGFSTGISQCLNDHVPTQLTPHAFSMRKRAWDLMLGAGMQMASRSGDMRRLLDACAAAVDLLVQEAFEPQQDPQNGGPSHISQHTQMSACGHGISILTLLMELLPGIGLLAYTP